MSMLSKQVDELRELAGDGGMEWVTGPIRASVLRDAADTIWSMRERLRAAYDEIQELQKRVRELDELLPDSGRWYSAKVTEAYVAENAKLRELVRELWEGYVDPPCEDCPLKDKPACADCPICAREAAVIDRVRELGVEVDG